MALIPIGYRTGPTEYGVQQYRAGHMTAQMWEDIGGLDMIMDNPVEPVSTMWERQAAAPPPTPWISKTVPKGIQELSISAQAGPTPLGICGLLNLVPGLGAWIGSGCSAMSVVTLAGTINGYYKSFRKRMFAVYFGRRLLGLMGQEGLDEFMKSTKRDVRTKIRIRRSS